MMSHYRSKH